MERTKTFIAIGLLFLLMQLGCSTEETTQDIPDMEEFIFEDGFETQSNDLMELFPSDGSRWSTIQKTDPTNASNEISIIESEFSEGIQALRIYAHASDSQLSKMDIEKNGLNIVSGQKVTIKADFFILGEQSIENLLLIDLECCSCWDPNVGDNYGAENQCPGVRLMMSGGNDFLSMERGKISGTTLQQTDVSFPRNQWVAVTWVMTMSDTDSGQNRLLINDVEVLNENAMNMPNPDIFREVFAKDGIDFELRQPLVYERVQIGATANPTAGNVELFVDNFSIRIEN